MSISFDSVPNGLLVPFVTAEFNSTRASQGPAQLPFRGLLIGQKTSAGTAAANSIVRCTNKNDAKTLCGRGSMLARMAEAWFTENQYTELWLGVLADNGSGVAATGTHTVTGPATAAGTIPLYIAGVFVPVAVANGDTQNTIASAIAAAVTANPDLPVSAAASTNVVTYTAKNAGTNGNYIDIRLAYQVGDALPAGVSIASVAMASGATDPSMTSLIAAMGDTWYHTGAHPFANSATALTAIETELARRFGPMVMKDGVFFGCATGTSSTLETLGQTRNSKHSVILSEPGKNPVTHPAEFAAAVAGVAAFYAAIDPGRTLQTLPITSAVPPADVDKFTFTERDLMLHDGIATTRVGPGGVVQIERLVTTYQQNSAGAADAAYRDATTMFNLMYLRYSFRNKVQNEYPRAKLANDGTRYGAGQVVVTPKIMRALAISWFRQMEDLGLVENSEQFANDLVVERDTLDQNRINILLSPDLINNLIVTAAKIQFIV